MQEAIFADSKREREVAVRGPGPRQSLLKVPDPEEAVLGPASPYFRIRK